MLGAEVLRVSPEYTPGLAEGKKGGEVAGPEAQLVDCLEGDEAALSLFAAHFRVRDR